MAIGVYLITCTANMRRYVGSSNNTVYRWRKHREKLARGTHWNRYLQRSWNKYGSEAFEFAVLEVVEDASQLQIREQHWIDTLLPEFNLSPFANRPTNKGLTHSEETRGRMSESNRRVWDELTEEDRKARGAKSSHPMSDSTRAKIDRTRKDRSAKRRTEWEAGREQREIERRKKLSAKLTGRQLSEETKAKLRAAATEQMSDPDMQAKHQEAVKAAMQRPEVKERHRKGIEGRPPMSEEHRKHIGEAHKGRKRPEGTGEKIAAAKRGKKHSPETIEKLKVAQQARWARVRAEKQKKE